MRLIRNPRVITLWILVFLFSAAEAQSENQETVRTRPDIPGLFSVDFGLNQAINPPPTGFKRGFWGSRALNVTYYKPIRLGKSKFSFAPGIGIAMERFKWANFYLLRDTTDNAEVYDLVPNNLYPGLKKSQLAWSYLEIPLEFRFDANPADPGRTFWCSIGGRVGLRMTTQTKVKMKEDDGIHKIKDRDKFGLNDVRLAATVRWGVGGFGWYVNYNITPLFEKGKGPQKTDFNVLTAGITLNGL